MKKAIFVSFFCFMIVNCMAYPDFDDEKNRTNRKLNECMVNKLVSFLNEIYKIDNAYPRKEQWAAVIEERYLGGEYDDCTKMLSYESGNIKDYFGDDVQYEFRSEQEVLVYSKNSKYLSEEMGEGEFPIMGFLLHDGEARMFLVKP